MSIFLLPDGIFLELFSYVLQVQKHMIVFECKYNCIVFFTYVLTFIFVCKMHKTIMVLTVLKIGK